MSSVVEHLAELTGLRDRDVLDVSLVSSLRDLLQPETLAIYRAVGEAGQRHWVTRASLRRGDSAPRADPLWAEPGSLPVLEAHPQRLACMQGDVPVVEAGPPAVSCFPLVNEWGAIGVLEIVTPLPLRPEDQHLVRSILRIYRNFQSLLDYSERDSLTGLLNRKTFDDTFLRFVSAHARDATAADAPDDPRRHPTGAQLWMAVIDIDHFKRVNDNFGHLIGDEVLLLLSRLMRSSFRFNDHLYRFGGEEFVVLMRCADAPAARAVLERLRTAVQHYAFPQVGRITVSVGSTVLRPADHPGAAFDRADKALYWVKQHGRNQVADHADLVAAGQLVEVETASDVELF